MSVLEDGKGGNFILAKRSSKDMSCDSLIHVNLRSAGNLIMWAVHEESQFLDMLPTEALHLIMIELLIDFWDTFDWN